MLWREGTLLSEAPFPSSFAPQALMANLSLPPLLFFFFLIFVYLILVAWGLSCGTQAL